MDDSFYFQGLPPTTIPQTLQTSHEENLASDDALRKMDFARVSKRLAADDAARSAAWAARMAILNE